MSDFFGSGHERRPLFVGRDNGAAAKEMTTTAH
jgi:hypothetical protein